MWRGRQRRRGAKDAHTAASDMRAINVLRDLKQIPICWERQRQSADRKRLTARGSDRLRLFALSTRLAASCPHEAESDVRDEMTGLSRRRLNLPDSWQGVFSFSGT